MSELMLTGKQKKEKNIIMQSGLTVNRLGYHVTAVMEAVRG